MINLIGSRPVLLPQSVGCSVLRGDVGSVFRVSRKNRSPLGGVRRLLSVFFFCHIKSFLGQKGYVWDTRGMFAEGG